MTNSQTSAANNPAAPARRINVDEVADILLGQWKKERLEGRRLAADPEMQRDPLLGMNEHRERVLGQLAKMPKKADMARPFGPVAGGGNNHAGNIAFFEETVLADPSLQIKSGVQWGLFASAVLHLGTKRHHEKYLADIVSFKLPGAYAMTEIGHGSDVASLATTATYDEKTKEFVINTPFRAATKDYLGNAALHGQAAVVFAQLITKGVNHGVHAFFVPIRTPDGKMLPGITSEDDGLKGGLNGIDNGRLSFDNVRIPREDLLNRYGDVAEDGTYSSPIKSPGRRFFTMLGTLVQGRVSLTGGSTVALRAGLDIAVTYANQRRQFTSADPDRETVLLDYQLHQRRLLPYLATAYAQTFAQEQLLSRFQAVFSGEEDTPENREDLETFAAGIKALSTWNAIHGLQEFREACGGAGFIAENRFVQLRADLDIYTTFEGDNNVLLQLVGKRLLTDYSAQFAGLDQRETAMLFAGQAAQRVFSGSRLRAVTQTVADMGQNARSAHWMRRPETQHALLTSRVADSIAGIAGRMRNAKKLSQAEAAALFNDNQYELIEAARAHVELLMWEAFTDGLNQVKDETSKRVLTMLRDLYGLTRIESDLAWYVTNGRLSPQRAAVLPTLINRMLAKLRPHAQDLVDAFGYTDEHLRATIATGIEQKRQDEAHAYFEQQRASGNAPISEHARYKEEQRKEREAKRAEEAAAAEAARAERVDFLDDPVAWVRGLIGSTDAAGSRVNEEPVAAAASVGPDPQHADKAHDTRITERVANPYLAAESTEAK